MATTSPNFVDYSHLLKAFDEKYSNMVLEDLKYMCAIREIESYFTCGKNGQSDRSEMVKWLKDDFIDKIKLFMNCIEISLKRLCTTLE